MNWNPCYVLAFFVSLSLPLSAAEPAPLTFERDIRPIFKANCFQCHGEEEKPKGEPRPAAPSIGRQGGRLGGDDYAG